MEELNDEDKLIKELKNKLKKQTTVICTKNY